jgi:hypothetical protein
VADDIVASLRASAEWIKDVEHQSWFDTADLQTDVADEIEQLRRLCSYMATLLDDCRPADASLVWVMDRLDTLEEWQAYSQERGL